MMDTAGTEPGQEPAAHRFSLDEPQGAGVGVGQHRFPAESIHDFRQPGRYFGQRFVPRNGPEPTFSLLPNALHRMEYPIFLVSTGDVTPVWRLRANFRAQEFPGYGMLLVSYEPHGLSIDHFYHIGTPVRAIPWADAIHQFGFSHALPPKMIHWALLYQMANRVAAYAHPASPPPSTANTVPVTKEESSLARNNTERAISSGVPTRPSGRSAASARNRSAGVPSGTP